MAFGKKNNKNSKKQKQHAERARPQYGPRLHSVAPPALRVVLPYAQMNVMTEAAAGLGYAQSYAINSPFDPDFTGGGLQPIGFTPYKALYGRYRVLGIRIECDMSNQSAFPVMAGMYASPQSTMPATSQSWIVENQFARARQLAPISAGGNTFAFRAQYSLPKVMGVTKNEYVTDQDFSALMTASPARVAYLHTWIRGYSNVAVCATTIRLWFDVEFSQPVALNLS